MESKILAKQILNGSERAIAQGVSLIEKSWEGAQELLQALAPLNKQPQVIGVTGPPGAGKSTLVDHLARAYHVSGKKVAVLAVDPSSPFSGGAILGDRVRMALAEELPGLFIRSMATRGALGGLARAARDSVSLLGAAGFEIVIIETVGVGQAEVDVASIAQTILVVLIPGSGDSVQALKAGVLEIADIFVLNKSDRPGIDALEKDLKLVLSLAESKSEQWPVALLRTVASEGKGIGQVVSKIQEHYHWQANTAFKNERKKKILLTDIKQIVCDRYWQKISAQKIEQVLQSLANSEISLQEGVEKLEER